MYVPQQSRLGGGPRPAMNGSMGAHWKPSPGPGSFGDFFGIPPAGIMGMDLILYQMAKCWICAN